MDTTSHAILAGLPQKQHCLEAQEPLFLAGQRATRLFHVRSGSIRLLRTLENGTNAVLQTARANEWVAEASLFSERYHCDAVAGEPTVLVSVSKKSLLARFENDGASAVAFARSLALQLRYLRQMHEIVRVRRAEDRLLAWLALRANGNPPSFVLDRTWSEVADELALTREALYRTLSVLKRRGRVRIRDRKVVVAR